MESAKKIFQLLHLRILLQQHHATHTHPHTHTHTHTTTNPHTTTHHPTHTPTHTNTHKHTHTHTHTPLCKSTAAHFHNSSTSEAPTVCSLIRLHLLRPGRSRGATVLI